MSKITVNGNSVEWRENFTVRAVLKHMNYTFKMLIVKVNGQLVKKDQYDKYLIPRDADVKVIHLIGGG